MAVRIEINLLYNYKPMYIVLGEARAATPNSNVNKKLCVK